MSAIRKEILEYFLPAWARRAGASDACFRAASMALETVEVISLETRQAYAGAHLFDALYLAAEDRPRDVRDYIPIFSQLDTGGVAIVECEDSARRLLAQLAVGAGLTLRQYGPPEKLVSPVLARAIRASTDAPRRLAVFECPPGPPSRENGRVRVSVLVIGDLARAAAWGDMLRAHHLLDSVEVVLVRDGEPFPESRVGGLQALHNHGALRVATHFRAFGAARCYHTALTVARGDAMLCDADPGLACEQIFPVLERWYGVRGDARRPCAVSAVALRSGTDGILRGRRAAAWLLLNRSAAALVRGTAGLQRADSAVDAGPATVPLDQVYRALRRGRVALLEAGVQDMLLAGALRPVGE